MKMPDLAKLVAILMLVCSLLYAPASSANDKEEQQATKKKKS